MYNDLTESISAIFKAITITSPASFTIGGKHISVNQLSGRHQGQTAFQNPLGEMIQQQIYQFCFCQRLKEPLVDLPGNLQPVDAFVQSLSAANTSRESWDIGWQIHSNGANGHVFAHKAGKTRGLWPGEYINDANPGMMPQQGMSIKVRCPRESSTLQPGFYFAFGETLTDQQDEHNVVRYYWNINPEGATHLIRTVTHHLNRFQVPFRLKCLTMPASYARLDPAVLYVGKRYYRIAAELLIDVLAAVQPYLGQDTPIFTKQLAPGLAFAEDPGQNESFGMHRCRMLAESITNAYARGFQTVEARLHELAALFDTYKIPVDRPYMNSGSFFEYEFPDFLTEPVLL